MYSLGRILLSITLLLIGMASFVASDVQAQQLAPATITQYAITTVDGKVVREAPLMVGATYKISFTVEVAAGLKEMCVLKTYLDRAAGSDRFWTLKNDYAGIDADSWQPGNSTLGFDAVSGSAQLELIGSVPENYVTEILSNGQNLHVAKDIAMIELSLASGQVIGDVKLEAIDSSIEDYRSLLSEKKELLAEMNADPAYTRLAEALITSSEAQASVGYLETATETLKAIPNSGWANPQASTSYQWIIIGILAVAAVVCGFFLIKARNEAGFIKRQTDGQAKRLQILALKAKRIGDSSLTESLEQVSKELQQAGGGS